ncbi:hypothetical protein [Fibrobacter sp. UWR2]|uniref:hypothetical protein n=1 Tax=Fibrobacter sp. UWR2 TaxID=1964352 RepID=UPI0013032797|nr:hypothetical protein [Fibrobacter sp. UWR2]
MLFSMLMSIIPVISLWGYKTGHEDFLALILFLAAIAELLAIPLSLLNLFLFKKNLSIKAAKRIATIPLGLCIVCSTILLMYSIVIFYDGNSSVIITSVATMLQLFVAIIAISWFRNKIEELYTHL